MGGTKPADRRRGDQDCFRSLRVAALSLADIASPRPDDVWISMAENDGSRVVHTSPILPFVNILNFMPDAFA